jgi:hypothetical protein
MKRFSHAFVIAFEADSDSEKSDGVTTEELLAGLNRRGANLAKSGNEIKEAVTSWGDDPIDREPETLVLAASSVTALPETPAPAAKTISDAAEPHASPDQVRLALPGEAMCGGCGSRLPSDTSTSGEYVHQNTCPGCGRENSGIVCETVEEGKARCAQEALVQTTDGAGDIIPY